VSGEDLSTKMLSHGQREADCEQSIGGFALFGHSGAQMEAAGVSRKKGEGGRQFGKLLSDQDLNLSVSGMRTR